MVADSKVRPPPFYVGVELLQTGIHGLAPRSRCHFFELGFDPIRRFVRQVHQPSFLLVTAEPKPQEVNVVRLADGALVRVHLQPQSLLKETTDRGYISNG